MAKLYPPYIEGTIPAFYGTTLVVPFSMNQAVSGSEVGNIILKVKKINSNEIILTTYASNFNVDINYKATFDLSEYMDKFNIGQYYRIQIAYVDNTNTIGYFSSVGVVKYTAIPHFEIVGLNRHTTNMHLYDYTLLYKQLSDPTEKLYSTRMRLLDPHDVVIKDTGDILHSVLNDTIPNQAIEYFNIPQDLEVNLTYKLYVTGITTNGLELSTPKYRISQRDNKDLKFDRVNNLAMTARINNENASGEIKLRNIATEQGVISGTFVLYRTEAKLPYEWTKIKSFTLEAASIKDAITADYTIEQGKNYIYSIQQYNNYGIYSSRIISNEVYADFEDLYLLDGERQLKIRFNPKVASMKSNIQDSKTNTIGSKYPFITRNGKVNHKEFSLSGLISYQMDENRDFMEWKDLGINQNITDLISENIQAERSFKLEVLDWLNNGKPKILKSPVEGNYVVRIMNVSLSPDDVVGRMLHSFDCSAVEIAPFTYDTLTKYNFIDILTPEEEKIIVSKWKTVNFSERVVQDYDEMGNPIYGIQYKSGELLSKEFPAYFIKVIDMIPGSKIYINNEEFYIGSTGAYIAKVTAPIYSFRLPENAQYTGTMVYEYKDIFHTQFDEIRAIKLYENPCQQIIGNSYWNDLSISPNLVEALQCAKTKIGDIPYVRFTKRGVHKIYVNSSEGTPTVNSQFYINGMSYNDEYKINLNDLDKLSLYEIHYSAVGCTIADRDGEIYYIKDDTVFKPYTETYYDPQHNIIIEDSFEMFNIQINNEYFNLEETEEYTLKNFDLLNIKIGDGIIAELSILFQQVDYSYELNIPSIKALRTEFDAAYEAYQRKVITTNAVGLDEDLITLKNLYKELNDAVAIAIEEDVS